MNKKSTVNKLPRVLGGTAIAAVAAVTAYTLRDAVAQSPQAGALPPASQSAPVVKSSAVQDAAAMQTAFAQVAKVAEPAVVTITTAQRQRQMSSNNNDMMRRFFERRGQGGGNDDDGPSIEDFLRQFRGGPEQNDFQPNKFQGDVATDPANGFRLTQGSRSSQNPPSPKSPNSSGQLVETGVGSGVIYDKSGLILTNAHVVEGADRVTVKLLDGREFKDAKVLGVDTRTDIAVVKIPVTDAPAVTLGDSGKVQVGDWAIAVGNPFGLSNTLTVGVISASAREVSLAENGSLTDYLQTDASINPGNSGGALLDIYGRVIGINNAIYSRTGSNVGIGFAIPINVAKQVADSLVKYGKVRRALIGVQMSNVNAQNAAAFGLPAETKGVIVQRVVPNSPAAKGGVQVGDIITGWNDKTITRDAELQRNVTSSPVGQPGKLTVLRNGKTVHLSLTPAAEETVIESRPSSSKTPAPEAPAPQSDELGVALAPLNSETRTQFRVPASVTSGVVVARIKEDSPASRAGISQGDVITRVGQTPVNSPEDVNRAKATLLKGQTGDKQVAFYVTKPSGDSGFVVVTLGE